MLIANYDIMTGRLLQDLVEIARSAGTAIMGVYKTLCADGDVHVAYKQGASPVSQADLLAHAVIGRGLAALDPVLPVVSEEDAASLAHRLPSRRYWLVDPLDGTREFLNRSDEFTVNIALIENGIATAGVIVAPALGQTYWAAAGEGAWAAVGNGIARIEVSASPRSGPFHVTASKSHLDAATRDFIAKLGPCSLIQAGSSLKFCRIAEGVADLYPRFGPTCEWDIAAGQAILEAAGGHVVTLDGAAMRYGKADVVNPAFVASNGCFSI